MLPKIRYRLCWNYASRLNRMGMAPVALECRQGKRKVYLTSNVMLYPHQWEGGMVVNCDNAEKLTAYLVRWRNSVEEIELDQLLRGRRMTLFQLKTALRSGVRPNATVREFVDSVIAGSDRKATTQQGYRYMCNEIEKEYGKITLDDVTYDWVEKWRISMKRRGVSDNTVKGRMKLLRCVVNEALKRNLITEDPFRFVTIGNMTPRKGDYLDVDDVRKLENASLDGKEAHVRDAFLFCVYTGLRYGDFRNLKGGNIVKDRLVIEQLKTGGHLELPIRRLFGGKALDILSKYESVEEFVNIGVNTTANRTLKEIARKIRLKKEPHWHSSRKTCATLLNQAGLKMQEIQYILGHSRIEVTEKHYATTAFCQVEKSLKKAFKNKDDSQKSV